MNHAVRTANEATGVAVIRETLNSGAEHAATVHSMVIQNESWRCIEVMPTETSDATAARERLAVKAARQRIDERELERAIYQAANHAGLSQRQISDIVGIHSQATVQRILRRLTEDPSLLDQTPAEIIDRRAAGMIDDHAMMEGLLDWKYSFGGVVRIDGVATDAYTTGDWDDIEMAFYRGLLSDDEFQALATRHLKSI